MSLCIPDEQIFKKKIKFFVAQFFFLFAFCLQTTLQQIYNILLNWCRHIDKCNTASLLGGIHGISASCCTLLKPLKYKLCFALSQECLDIISVILFYLILISCWVSHSWTHGTYITDTCSISQVNVTLICSKLKRFPLSLPFTCIFLCSLDIFTTI